MNENLLHGEVTVTGKIYGGGSELLKGVLNDGTPVALKTLRGLRHSSLRRSVPDGSDLQREMAASIVAKALPVIAVLPEMVYRDVPTIGEAVVMEFINGWGHGTTNAGERRRQAVFDSLIGNTDRHDGNQLYRSNPSTGKQEIVLIDHGLAFPDRAEHDVYCNSLRGLSGTRLPKYAMWYFTRLQKIEPQMRRALHPLIGQDATDRMYLRASLMQTTGRFLSPRDF